MISFPNAAEAGTLAEACVAASGGSSDNAIASASDCGGRASTVGAWLVTCGCLSLVHPFVCLGCALAVGVASSVKAAGNVVCGMVTVPFLLSCDGLRLSIDDFGSSWFGALMMIIAVILAIDTLGSMCALVCAAASTGCKVGEPFLDARP